MSKSNGEEDSLPPNQSTNATPNSKPPSSSSDGLDRSSSCFSDVCPSFFGAYPNRSRVHIKPRNDISNRDSASEIDKLLVISQLGARITRGFKHSLILYLLSFTCIVSVPYAAYLQNRVAKLQEGKTNLCCLCGDNYICNGSIPHFGNSDSRTVALYTVVFTIFMPLLFYKYLDRIPPIKRLSKSTKISEEEVPLKKRVAYTVDVCFSIYPYAKLLALLYATIFLIGFGGLALYAVSETVRVALLKLFGLPGLS